MPEMYGVAAAITPSSSTASHHGNATPLSSAGARAELHRQHADDPEGREAERPDDQAAPGQRQGWQCRRVGGARHHVEGRQPERREQPPGDADGVDRGRRRRRRGPGPARPGRARSRPRWAAAAADAPPGTATPPRGPGRGTPASAPLPRRGARWRRRTRPGAGRPRTGRRREPGATPGEAGASDRRRARTVGTSRSTAAPAMRRNTTEPGVQPVSINDLAKGPEVAKVTAATNASRSPALVDLVDIVHRLSGAKVSYTGYSRSMYRQESM